MIGKLKKRCEFFFKKCNNKAPNIEHLLGEFYKALCSSIRNVYMHLLVSSKQKVAIIDAHQHHHIHLLKN